MKKFRLPSFSRRAGFFMLSKTSAYFLSPAHVQTILKCGSINGSGANFRLTCGSVHHP